MTIETKKAKINNFPAEIRLVPIDSVFPNKWNPNVETEFIFNTLKRLIDEIGFVVPVIVREIEKDTYEIIDGEHRLKAAKDNGYTDILVANLGKIEKDDMPKILTISINNTKGVDDILKRAQVLKDLKRNKKNMLFQLTPFEEKQIEEELKLLDFDFSKFGKNDITNEEKEELKQITQTILSLDKKLRKLHDRAKSTNLRIMIESYFEWAKRILEIFNK